jgi:predicted acyltransferase
MPTIKDCIYSNIQLNAASYIIIAGIIGMLVLGISLIESSKLGKSKNSQFAIRQYNFGIIYVISSSLLILITMVYKSINIYKCKYPKSDKI